MRGTNGVLVREGPCKACQLEDVRDAKTKVKQPGEVSSITPISWNTEVHDAYAETAVR